MSSRRLIALAEDEIAALRELLAWSESERGQLTAVQNRAADALRTGVTVDPEQLANLLAAVGSSGGVVGWWKA